MVYTTNKEQIYSTEEIFDGKCKDIETANGENAHNFWWPV